MSSKEEGVNKEFKLLKEKEQLSVIADMAKMATLSKSEKVLYELLDDAAKKAHEIRVLKSVCMLQASHAKKRLKKKVKIEDDADEKVENFDSEEEKVENFDSDDSDGGAKSNVVIASTKVDEDPDPKKYTGQHGNTRVSSEYADRLVQCANNLVEHTTYVYEGPCTINNNPKIVLAAVLKYSNKFIDFDDMEYEIKNLNDASLVKPEHIMKYLNRKGVKCYKVRDDFKKILSCSEDREEPFIIFTRVMRHEYEGKKGLPEAWWHVSLLYQKAKIIVTFNNSDKNKNNIVLGKLIRETKFTQTFESYCKTNLNNKICPIEIDGSNVSVARNMEYCFAYRIVPKGKTKVIEID